MVEVEVVLAVGACDNAIAMKTPPTINTTTTKAIIPSFMPLSPFPPLIVDLINFTPRFKKLLPKLEDDLNSLLSK